MNTIDLYVLMEYPSEQHYLILDFPNSKKYMALKISFAEYNFLQLNGVKVK